MTTPALTCAEVEPLLPLVADGALDAKGDPDLFDHLAVCPACQDALATHDLVTLALERKPSAPKRRPIRWVWPAALAASVLVALFSAGMLSSSAPTEPVVAAGTQVVQPTDLPTTSAVAKTSAPAGKSNENPVIDVDVAAVPSPIPGRTMYLVRRGDQVVLVDPSQPPLPSAPNDTKPATFHRY